MTNLEIELYEVEHQPEWLFDFWEESEVNADEDSD